MSSATTTIFLVAVLTLTSATLTSAEWLTGGGDFGRTGYVAETVGAKPTPAKAWTANYSASYAAIYDGVGFVTARLPKCTLTSFNPVTGDTIHTAHMPKGWCSAPTISPTTQLVYVTVVPGNSGGGGPAGPAVHYAFSVGNLTQVWSNTDWFSFGGLYPFGAVASGQSVFFPAGHNANYITAYSESTGHLQFTKSLFTNTGAPCGKWAPALHNGSVYWSTEIGGIDGSAAVGAISASSGTSVWSNSFTKHDSNTQVGMVNWYPVVSADGTVIASPWNTNTGNTTFTASSELQSLIWEYSCGTSTGSVATDGTFVFVNCGLGTYGETMSNTGVNVLDLQTGKHISTYHCADCFGTPIVTKDAVFQTTINGNVKIFSRSSALLIGSVEASVADYTTMAMSFNGGILYVTDMANGGMTAWKV